uniref:Uncharacterized protein n=1 Tax=Arundo donax TaxID=35708 RepID=A0A0A9CHA0_ARUDO
MGTMELSGNPPFGDKEFAVVELGESRLGMFVSTDVDGSALRLISADKQNSGEGTNKWERKDYVFLSRSY